MTIVDDLDVPVLCAPMAGGPTTPGLVAAVAEAGAMGILAAGYLTAGAFEPLLRQTWEATGGRFGVNLFLPGSDVAADGPSGAAGPQIAAYRRRLEPYASRRGVQVGDARWSDEDLDAKIGLLARCRPSLVTITFGEPDPAMVDALHDEVRAPVAVTVTSVDEARSAVSAGADMLVVQGFEAGGHRGIWVDVAESPVGGPATGTTDLLVQVAEAVEVPLVAAGGIMTGAGIASVLDRGAVAAQLGTAFLLADEAGTSAVYRSALLDPGRRAEVGSGTVITRAFSGRSARSLRNRFTEELPDAPAAYPHVHYMTKPIRAAATAAGVVDEVNLWAGTGWREATAGPASEIVARLSAELATRRA